MKFIYSMILVFGILGASSQGHAYTEEQSFSPDCSMQLRALSDQIDDPTMRQAVFSLSLTTQNHEQLRLMSNFLWIKMERAVTRLGDRLLNCDIYAKKISRMIYRTGRQLGERIYEACPRAFGTNLGQ